MAEVGPRLEELRTRLREARRLTQGGAADEEVVCEAVHHQAERSLQADGHVGGEEEDNSQLVEDFLADSSKRSALATLREELARRRSMDAFAKLRAAKDATRAVRGRGECHFVSRAERTTSTAVGDSGEAVQNGRQSGSLAAEQNGIALQDAGGMETHSTASGEAEVGVNAAATAPGSGCDAQGYTNHTGLSDAKMKKKQKKVKKKESVGQVEAQLESPQVARADEARTAEDGEPVNIPVDLQPPATPALPDKAPEKRKAKGGKSAKELKKKEKRQKKNRQKMAEASGKEKRPQSARDCSASQGCNRQQSSSQGAEGQRSSSPERERRRSGSQRCGRQRSGSQRCAKQRSPSQRCTRQRSCSQRCVRQRSRSQRHARQRSRSQRQRSQSVRCARQRSRSQPRVRLRSISQKCARRRSPSPRCARRRSLSRRPRSRSQRCARQRSRSHRCARQRSCGQRYARPSRRPPRQRSPRRPVSRQRSRSSANRKRRRAQSGTRSRRRSVQRQGRSAQRKSHNRSQERKTRQGSRECRGCSIRKSRSSHPSRTRKSPSKPKPDEAPPPLPPDEPAPLPPSPRPAPAPLPAQPPAAVPEVHTEATPALPVPAALGQSPAEGPNFRPGCRVSLRGLKKNSGFNGQHGTVLDPQEDGAMTVPGTVRVLLDAGAEVAAKPQNLELVLETPSLTQLLSYGSLPGMNGLHGGALIEENSQELALQQAMAAMKARS